MNSRTIQSLLNEASAIDRVDAEALLCHLLQQNPTWLFIHADDVLGDAQVSQFRELVSRRIAGEPVAYLVGSRGFWSMDFLVDQSTLIPRADTEILVELALERTPSDRPVDVLDLGTGSGAIALSIAKERPHANVVATDLSERALAIARKNAEAYQLANVEFLQGAWFTAIDGHAQFDVIVSNPPYIEDGDPHLVEGDLRFEPVSALSSGADGLDDIRQIVAGAPKYLKNSGWLMIEHGYDQTARVQELLREAGFDGVGTRKDFGGCDRVTFGQLHSIHQENKGQQSNARFIPGD